MEIGSHGSLGAPETVVAIIVFSEAWLDVGNKTVPSAVIFVHPLCGKNQFAIPSEIVDC